MLMVNAFLATMLPWVLVARRKDTATHGGCEQQMPPHAAVMTLGLPASS